jgi:hypothetical protein
MKKEMSDLKNRGMLLVPTLEQNGLIIPDGYKVCRLNSDHIVSMVWDPIGHWEPTQNQVLKLTTEQCRLEVLTDMGTKMRFSFKENDYRYSVDKWVIFCYK